MINGYFDYGDTEYEFCYDKSKDESDITFYVDGSYYDYYRRGTYGCTSTLIEAHGKVNVECISARICEMYAILKAIKIAIQYKYKSVTVFTDNTDCIYIVRNWKCRARESEWFINELKKLELLCNHITLVWTSRSHQNIKKAHNLCKLSQ